MLGLCASPAAAQSSPAAPRLAIIIHAEGLSSEMLERHRASFTGGLGRLARGKLFTNASAGEAGVTQLASALGNSSVKVAVGGSSAPVGAGFNQNWSWNGQRFAERTRQAQPRIIPVANQAIAMLIGRAEPALTLPPACAGSTPSSRFARAAGDSAGFSASPALDAATLAVGAGLVGELRMGTDSAGDLLVLQLPATARAAQAHGAASDASCLQMLSLDRDLAGFFSQLDRGGINYVVALAGSAAAGQAVPLIFWRTGMTPSASAAPASTGDLAPTMAAWLGVPMPASNGAGRCLEEVAGTSCPR